MSKLKDSNSINRQDFLTAIVESGGVTYVEAAKIYDAMTGIFADAIIQGRKVNIGTVMSISPYKKKARKVVSNLGNVKTECYLGSRISFRVNVFKSFMEAHQINWQL